MNRVVTLLLLVAVMPLAVAAPTLDDVRLATEYKDVVFSAGSKEADADYDYCKLYRLQDGTNLWIYDEGFTVAQTKDGVTVTYYLEDGRTTERSIEVPSGRICSVDDEGDIIWGIVKEPAPDFRLGTLGNRTKKVRLSELKGKVVLLDFWASWCSPCMAGLPETEALYQKFKDRGLLVFGINIEGDERKATAAVKSTGITFPVLMGDSTGGEYDWSCKQIVDYGIHGIPALFLIDEDGIIQKMDGIDEDLLEEIL